MAILEGRGVQAGISEVRRDFVDLLRGNYGFTLPFELALVTTASARSQCALPGLNSKRQIAVGTAGLRQQAPDRSVRYRALTASARSQWALPGYNNKRQIAVSFTGPQQQAPDRSELHGTTTASARSQ
eukprot:g17389.t1